VPSSIASRRAFDQTISWRAGPARPAPSSRAIARASGTIVALYLARAFLAAEAASTASA